MLYALNWFGVASLLALWSLATWMLHAVVAWTATNVGTLSGAASGVGGSTLPDWLAPWVPAALVQSLNQLLAGLGPMIDGLLQAAPTLVGGLTVATWAIWGIGSVLLIMMGAGMHVLIALWHRRGGHRPGQNTHTSLTMS